LEICPVNGIYVITTPGGSISSNHVCRGVPIQIGNTLIKSDLLLLDLKGMDVLLGMNWMTQYHVSIDIPSRTMEIGSPENKPTLLYLPPPKSFNSCTYATSGVKLEDIPVVCEYPDVFPDDLPGMILSSS
jgi:hypothetical protein